MLEIAISDSEYIFIIVLCLSIVSSYLGRTVFIGDVKKQEFETYEEMIQNRKHVLAYIRAHQRKELDKRKLPKKSILPELSELDVKKYLSDTEVKEDQQKDYKVPELEEYIKMLNEHERIEILQSLPEKPKFKKVVKKYRPINLEDERFGDEVGGVTDSISCKLHCYDQDTSWRNLTDRTKRNFLIEKLKAAGGNVTVKPKKKVKKEPKAERKLIIPLVYVTTISGITYLHPVSKLVVQKQWQERAAAMSGRIIQKLEEEKKKQSRTPSPAKDVKEVKEQCEENGTGKPMFPKAVPLVKGRESPDVVSDEESDEVDDSAFDTTRLNKDYSIEKIKKILREQRAKERTGKFNQVLQKYFRMQSVLKAFAPKPKRSRRLSVSPSKYSGYSAYHIARPKKKVTKFNLPRLAQNKEEKEKGEKGEKVAEKMTVGKLKHFRFLDARQKTMPVGEAIPEERYDAFPMEDFRLNTERALEEFVVRREIIVSDSSTKKSVSITFTKKSVFTKSKFSCD